MPFPHLRLEAQADKSLIVVLRRPAITAAAGVLTEIISRSRHPRKLGDLPDDMLQAHEPYECEILVQSAGAFQGIAAPCRPRIVAQGRRLVPCEGVTAWKKIKSDNFSSAKMIRDTIRRSSPLYVFVLTWVAFYLDTK